MIVWGARGDSINLGTKETMPCPTCEKDRPFDLVVQYRYGGLYWVFNYVMKKTYLLLCSVCGRGWELPEKQMEKEIPKLPIPFMRQWGLLTLIVAVSLVIFGIKQQAKRERLDRGSPPSVPAASDPVSRG